MSDRDEAAAAADVNCELTLRPPYPSPSSIVDDDVRRPPATPFLPSPYTSLRPPPLPPPNSQSLPLPQHVSNHSPRPSHSSRRGGHALPYSVRSSARSNPTQSTGRNKSDTIPPPFPWAADRRATLRSLEYLQAAGLVEVPGDSQCRHCEARITIKLDLAAKFHEVVGFMYERQHLMHDRAPEEWTNPTFPGCESCGEMNCVRPVMADKKRSINWLFLFLGQWLGCCTLEQLKYFCKHNKLHRTAAKNRLLYMSYFCICMQLDPTLPFFQ